MFKLSNALFFLSRSAFVCFLIRVFNPSSPKGGCTNPRNGYHPGAQNRTAKG